MKRVSAGSTGHGRAGPDRHQAGGRFRAHSRIHLFVRRALSKGRDLCLSDMPRSDTACFQVFLNALSRKFARQDILLVLDGAPKYGLPRHECLPAISRCSSCRHTRQSSTRRTISGRKSAKNFEESRARINRRRAHQAQAAIYYIECNPETVKVISVRRRNRVYLASSNRQKSQGHLIGSKRVLIQRAGGLRLAWL